MLVVLTMVLAAPRSCTQEPQASSALDAEPCDLGPFARANDADLEWTVSCWTGPRPSMDTLPVLPSLPDRAFRGAPRRPRSATDAHAVCALRDPSRWRIAHAWLSWKHGFRWKDDAAHWNVFNGLRMDDHLEPLDPDAARACLLEAWSLPDPEPERCGPPFE